MTTDESKPGDGVPFSAIEDFFNSLVGRSNATPLDDFSGLSPDQMHHLLYYPFGERSSICLRENISDDTLNSIPFFRLVEEFTRIVAREGVIKLTPKGALPRKILREIYGFGFLKEEFIEKGYVKLMKEADPGVHERSTAFLRGCQRFDGARLSYSCGRSHRSLCDRIRRCALHHAIRPTELW